MAARTYVTREIVAPHGVWGPNEATRSWSSALDWAMGRALAGHSGAVRIGAPTIGVHRFSGDLGPLQRFATMPFGAMTGTFRSLNNYALPATNPKAAVNPVLGAMVRNSLGASLQ